MEEQYVRHLSDFLQWEQLEHSQDWVIHPGNITEYLSIDETSLAQGELYTIITNKQAKGQKGALVAIIKGTDSEKVSNVLLRIPKNIRNRVKEITLDMASSMKKIVENCFKKATQVIDRFHVQKLGYEALQEIRIMHRWEAIEQENKEIELCKEEGKKYIPYKLENGDTLKQLLARSRYLLFKHHSSWTTSQCIRAEILFKLYPDIERAYELCIQLGDIYKSTKNKNVALTKLAQWYDKVEKLGFKSFNTIARTIQHNYRTILNFFDNRSTNASAESFNAKIKAFRSQFRGVKNVSFFLFRLSKIYG